MTGKINGMDIPAQEQKIDLTKPYDPTKSPPSPADRGQGREAQGRQGENRGRPARSTNASGKRTR